MFGDLGLNLFINSIPFLLSARILLRKLRRQTLNIYTCQHFRLLDFHLSFVKLHRSFRVTQRILNKWVSESRVELLLFVQILSHCLELLLNFIFILVLLKNLLLIFDKLVIWLLNCGLSSELLQLEHLVLPLDWCKDLFNNSLTNQFGTNSEIEMSPPFNLFFVQKKPNQ